jgi:hypothetical protein
MENRMSDQRTSTRGEFVGAILFCLVLPALSVAGLVIDYFRHGQAF